MAEKAKTNLPVPKVEEMALNKIREYQEEGMVLPGIISNITNFGCFVDIGVHEKGLVHISQLSDRYVSDPNEVVSLHQQVQVKVLQIDKERKRIALTLKV